MYAGADTVGITLKPDEGKALQAVLLRFAGCEETVETVWKKNLVLYYVTIGVNPEIAQI